MTTYIELLVKYDRSKAQRADLLAAATKAYEYFKPFGDCDLTDEEISVRDALKAAIARTEEEHAP